MRFFIPVAVLAVLAGQAAAQDPSQIPACVLTCSTNAAQSAGCSGITDLSCICTSSVFQNDAQSCLVANCSQSDQAAALALQTALCAGSSATGVSSIIPTSLATDSISIDTSAILGTASSTPLASVTSVASSISEELSSLASSAAQSASSAASSVAATMSSMSMSMSGSSSMPTQSIGLASTGTRSGSASGSAAAATSTGAASQNVVAVGGILGAALAVVGLF